MKAVVAGNRCIVVAAQMNSSSSVVAVQMKAVVAGDGRCSR